MRVVNVEFGPVDIAVEDLEVLESVTGLSREACTGRLERYHPREMADAWRKRNPVTPSEIRAFYASTDHYIWELLVWNATARYDEIYLKPVRELMRRWPAEENTRALDYGAGIGTVALIFAKAGYSVTVADIPGPTFDFARARLERWGAHHEPLEVESDEPRLPVRRWDVISCLDVIEHVPDPATLARALIEATTPSGGLAIKADFTTAGEDWPHHLAAVREKFGGGRWERFLRGLGLRKVAPSIYRRGPRLSALAARAEDALRRVASRTLAGARRGRRAETVR